MFSGSGVQRLRDFLNDNRTQRLRPNGTLIRDSDGPEGSDLDLDDNRPVSAGGSTPVMNIDTHGQPMGMSMMMPIVPTTAGGHHYNHLVGLLNQHGVHAHGSASYPPTGFAMTGGALWAGGLTPVVGGTAQQVTGMMGAAMLDDVDEGDEAFGEGSEIMDRD